MAEIWDYDAHIREQGGIKHKDRNVHSCYKVPKEHWESIFGKRSDKCVIIEAKGEAKLTRWPR